MTPSFGTLCSATCNPLSVKERLRPHALCTPLGFSRGLEEATGHPTNRLPEPPQCRAPLPRCSA